MDAAADASEDTPPAPTDDRIDRQDHRIDHQNDGDHRDHLDPLAHVPVPDPDHRDPAEVRLAEARAAAGRAVRDIGHAVVGRDAPVELIERVAAELQALVDELDRCAPRSRASAPFDLRRWEAPPPADGAPMTSYDDRPVSGRSSPWGLDLAITREGQEAVARLTLRAAHEGAPTRSHGGIVAALFDDVYGFVLDLEQQPGFTGELGIRYVAGTPVGVPLECRVRLEERSGRKLFMSGDLIDASTGTTVATSTATFIAIDPTVFAASRRG